MTADGGSESAALIGFKRHLRPEIVPGDAVHLISERGVPAVPGAPMAALAPLLDGTRDLPTVLRETAGDLPATHVGTLIGELTRSGLLERRAPGEPPADPAAQAYWAAAGDEPAARAGRWRRARPGSGRHSPSRRHRPHPPRKYSGSAYALTLKPVGVVQQTWYLLTTAMHPAGCAVGTGNSEQAARAGLRGGRARGTCRERVRCGAPPPQQRVLKIALLFS
jgi:hypothetical protein